MDFSKLDSRSAGETAREYHILSQQTGEPITGESGPCIVLIKGATSRSVQAALKAENAARVKDAKAAKAKGEADDGQSFEDMHAGIVKGAARLIAGFRGIQRPDEDGKLRDLTGSEADIMWFLDLNFMSLPHLMRHNALTQMDGEDPADFLARKASYAAEWHKPSFAQQVLDFAQDDSRFLPQPVTA